MQEGNLPSVSLALVEAGRVSYTAAFGVQDVTTRQAATPSTVYKVSCITKPVTALAFLQLQEQGQLQLDAPVTTYLPWFTIQNPFADATPITLRHLLTHTAGLARGPYLEHPPTPLDQMRALADQTLLFPPGAVYKYSNLGYLLAQGVLEAVMDMPFAAYMAQHVLGPLHMTASTFTPSQALSREMAIGYTETHYWSLLGKHRPLTVAPAFPLPTAAGELYTTATDYARFLASALTPERSLLSAPSQQAFLSLQYSNPKQPQNGTGLGFQIRTRGGLSVIHHSGSNSGYSALVVGFPRFQCGGVILTNRSSGYAALSNILDAAFQTMLPQKALPTEDASSYARYTGTYRCGDHVIHVEKNRSALSYRYRGEVVDLLPKSKQSFFQQSGPFSNYILRFSTKQNPSASCHAGPFYFVRDGAPALSSRPIPEHWQRLTGHYQYAPFCCIEVFIRRQRIYLLFAPLHETPLEPVTPYRFRLKKGPFIGEVAHFCCEASGAVARLEVAGMVFHRYAPEHESEVS